MRKEDLVGNTLGKTRTVQLSGSECSEMSKEKGLTVMSIKASATRGPPSRLSFA
jgi:hypothetical protein